MKPRCSPEDEKIAKQVADILARKSQEWSEARKNGLSLVGVGIPVPLDIVNKMFDLFCADYPIIRIAEECEVSRQTVYNYINNGDAERGIKPFSERRAEVWRKAMAGRDGKVAKAIEGFLDDAARAVGATSERYVQRVAKAADLEDPELYKEGNEHNLRSTLARSFNPDAESLAKIMKSAADIAKVGVALVEDKPSTNINVASNSSAQASAESLGDISVALAHIESVRNKPMQERGVINEVIKRINLGKEQHDNKNEA